MQKGVDTDSPKTFSNLYDMDHVNKKQKPSMILNHKIQICLMNKFLVKIDRSNMRILAQDLRHGRENTNYVYPLKELSKNLIKIITVICLKQVEAFQIVFKESK